MRKEPLLPQELWDKIPPDAQAAVLALVERHERTIARLEQRVAELEARLNQNSQNSSRPPSSDPPTIKRSPPRQPSGRPRGGQPGHARHQRPLVPPEEVHDIIVCKPTQCRRCGAALDAVNPQPKRHQAHESRRAGTAERPLRHAVRWRKTSYGTDSRAVNGYLFTSILALSRPPAI